MTEYAKRKAESLVGFKYEEDFCIDEELARCVIQANDSSLLRETTVKYGITYKKGIPMIVAVNESNLIEYAIPLEPEPIITSDVDVLAPASKECVSTISSLKKTDALITGAILLLIAGLAYAAFVLYKLLM